MSIHIKIQFENISTINQEILIAELFNWSFEGFEQTPKQLLAYLPQSAFNDQLQDLLQQLQMRQLFSHYTQG